MFFIGFIIYFALMMSPSFVTAGLVSLRFDPVITRKGENNVTISCFTDSATYVGLRMRQNFKDEWKPIVKAKTFAKYMKTFLMKEDYDLGHVTILGLDGLCYKSMCSLDVQVRIQSGKCLQSPESNQSFRCHSFDGQLSIYSSEKNILAIKGQSPRNISPPSIISRRNTMMINGSDTSIQTLQLQCIGEVENINAEPVQNIRWCLKDSGKFEILSQLIPSNNSIVFTSGDGCVVVQKSTISYSLSNRDSDVEIMCESGYSTSNDECGKGSTHSTLYIRMKSLAKV